MRQWELIGITDADPTWTPAQAPTEGERARIDAIAPGAADHADGQGNGSAYLWSTDSALRMRSVAPVAAALLGRDPEGCEGRDLLDVFGMEGPNLAVLEAHVAALSDEEGRFTLRGILATVRCRVSPMHGDDGRVIGTFCIARPDPALDALGDRLAGVAA
jgi:PAS domain-containing protein